MRLQRGLARTWVVSRLTWGGPELTHGTADRPEFFLASCWNLSSYPHGCLLKEVHNMAADFPESKESEGECCRAPRWKPQSFYNPVWEVTSLPPYSVGSKQVTKPSLCTRGKNHTRTWMTGAGSSGHLRGCPPEPQERGGEWSYMHLLGVGWEAVKPFERCHSR